MDVWAYFWTDLDKLKRRVVSFFMRVIYSKNKLDHKQRMLLTRGIYSKNKLNHNQRMLLTRVNYSKNKLNHNQCMLLAKSISSFEYSCRAFLFPPDTKFKTAGTLCIRPSLQCVMQIEVPCYRSDVDRADKCSHCWRTTLLWAKSWNKDLRQCSQCTSCTLTTERSVLHKDRMEKDKRDFFCL